MSGASSDIDGGLHGKVDVLYFVSFPSVPAVVQY